ncbi:protein LAZ1 homolog 2 [Ipomoea triloba]|uniref:protein LAZ1 homolog 2 n=1 Tax=Ipomoea triloba TaxID=35885 RepID=UPI00125DC32F|nr:protein LAZ1 homolog 2 [Ipomoea triloba]
MASIISLSYKTSTYKLNYLYNPAILIAASSFVFVALLLSMFLIFQHLRSYTNPAEQKWIVAVIFMVPVYATDSILSLWNSKLSLACDILRNLYEAFALYSFGTYLVACLGGERKAVELLEEESRKQTRQPLLGGEGKPKTKQTTTFYNFMFHPCAVGERMLTIEKFGLVQYMILKTLCALLTLVLELLGVYGDGEFKWYYGYPYIAAVLFFSQMWALYCLVQFYNVTHQRLRAIKPLAKFISFKAIVFATWWQDVGIALACYCGVLSREGKFQTKLQDFLICIEMAIAAIAHLFVFSAKPYRLLPSPAYGKITTQKTKTKTKTSVDVEDKKKAAVVEKTETEVEAPGTSVKKSVQDIVVGGGQQVVEDVVLTINQAIGPVEKGMTKIQEKFHQISVSSDEK